MATAIVDQASDSTVKAPCYENEVVNIPESQTDFNVGVSSCTLWSIKNNKFMF